MIHEFVWPEAIDMAQVPVAVMSSAGLALGLECARAVQVWWNADGRPGRNVTL